MALFSGLSERLNHIFSKLTKILSQYNYLSFKIPIFLTLGFKTLW